MPIASMCLAGKCDEIQEVSWSRLQWDTSKLLPQIPWNTSLQLELDTKALSSYIPEGVKMNLQELLNKKH